MGMGMPKAHRSTQPTFPFSFLNIFITVLFFGCQTPLPWTVTINSSLLVVGSTEFSSRSADHSDEHS
jgi:hypothetical protein